jgi:hypothetical protein
MIKVLAESLADAEEGVYDVTHRPVDSLADFVVMLAEVRFAYFRRGLARLGLVASAQETQVHPVESDYHQAA